MEIRKVGVLGCGLMGGGIAQVCTVSGYQTIVREVHEELLHQGLSRITESLDREVEKGRQPREVRDASVARLSGTTSLEMLRECDVVIEAIVEDLDTKRKTYAALGDIVKEQAIIVSNTSSLCIGELAASITQSERFAGLHFFNPVPVMKLVEVIRALMTSEDTYQTVFEFARSLGKDPIAAPDRPGFIVNRLLVPYLLDAIRAYEQGLGTLEDIDKGMTLGCGHPMGPFTLMDFIGLDTLYYIANSMFEEFRESRYAPPPLLKRMVLAGRLGRKAGCGFFPSVKARTPPSSDSSLSASDTQSIRGAKPGQHQPVDAAGGTSIQSGRAASSFPGR